MISLSLDEIARIVGGTVVGDGSVTVTAPAVITSANAEPGGLFVAFAGERVDGHDFADAAAEAGAVAVLGSRPTSLPTVVVADAAAALQALAVHVVAQLRDGLTVVAMTGSQGKTSTKDLIAAILSARANTVSTLGNLNNELGVPLTMLRATEDTRYLVVEMGARHMGDIAFLTSLIAPDVSIVLNVGHAHIGEFGSRDAIATAKSELVQGLAAGGTAVLNADDERVIAMRSLTADSVRSFGHAETADVRIVDLVLDRLGRPTFSLKTTESTVEVVLPLVGAHQAMNAAAVAAAALAIGIPLPAVAESLATVVPSRWRMETSELANGATLINDTYNASPGSTRAALDALASIDATRRIAVIGEVLELGDTSETEHHSIGEYAGQRADVVVAIGTYANTVSSAAGEAGVSLEDNATAIEWLRNNVAPGDVILLKASRGSRLDEVAAALV